MSVSYLITLYNKQEFIGRVLDAVLAEQAQTGGEIVIYDDLSSDRSRDIVQERIAAHPRQAEAVRVVRGEKNRGVGFATNYLIGIAAQPFTRLVDADDILVRGSTAHMLRLMKQHNLGFMFGQVTESGDDDKKFENQTYDQWFMLHEPVRSILRHTLAGPSPSLFVTDELRKTGPVPEWVKRTQDFLMTLRVANRGTRIGYVNEIVALRPANRTGNNLSTALAAMFAEMSRDVAHDGMHLPLPDLRYVSRRFAGRAAKYFRRRGKSRLSAEEKMNLWCWRNLGWLASRQDCIRRLEKTADLLERDKDVIVTGVT